MALSRRNASPDALEFETWCGLLGANPARDDLSLEIVFPFDRTASQAAQQGDLADVRKRVRDRPLKKPLDRAMQRFRRSQIVIEFFE